MDVGFLGVLELLRQPVYLKNEGIQRSKIVNVCLVMLKRIRVEQCSLVFCHAFVIHIPNQSCNCCSALQGICVAKRETSQRTWDCCSPNPATR